MKKIKKRDLCLILALVVLAGALLIYGLASRKPTSVPPVVNPTVTGTPEAGGEETVLAEVSEESRAKAEAYLEQYPADSYVVVTTSQNMYLPIPLTEEGAFKIHFGEDDYNLVHIGKDSVYMEESTCDNQNCVGQGEITLQNRDDRILYNMILCLPHELTLELVNTEEAAEYLAEYYEMQAVYEEMIAAMTAEQEGTANAG